MGDTGWLIYATVGLTLGSLAYGVWSSKAPDDVDAVPVAVRVVALAAFAVLWLPIVLWAAGRSAWMKATR